MYLFQKFAIPASFTDGEPEVEVKLTDTIMTGIGAMDIKNDNISYTADPGEIISNVGEPKSEPKKEVNGNVRSEVNGV